MGIFEKKIVSMQIISFHMDIGPREVFRGLSSVNGTYGSDGDQTQRKLVERAMYVTSKSLKHILAFASVVKICHHFCMLHNTVTFSLCCFYVQHKISLFFNPFLQRQKLFCLVSSKCRDPLHLYDNLSPWCAWVAS